MDFGLSQNYMKTKGREIAYNLFAIYVEALSCRIKFGLLSLIIREGGRTCKRKG